MSDNFREFIVTLKDKKDLEQIIVKVITLILETVIENHLDVLIMKN